MKNYSIWISNEIFQRLPLEFLGRDILGQRKNRTLLKTTLQMVMLSLWLANYMEHGCEAWFYREK